MTGRPGPGGSRVATGLLVISATAVSAAGGLFAISGSASVAEALGRSEAFALLVAAQQVAAGIGVVLGGVLVDRRGLRTTLVGGCVAAACGALLLLAAPTLTIGLVLRVVAGLGAGICQSVAIAVVPLLGRSGDRTRLFAVSSTVWGVAGITVPLAVAVLIAEVGWRGALVLEGGLAVVALVIFWAALGRRGQATAEAGGRIDLVGLVLLVGAALTVQLVVGAPTLAAAALPAAVGFAAAFWWWGGRARDPLLRHSQLVGPGLVPCHLAGVASFLGVWGVHAVLPVTVTDGLGASLRAGALALTLGSVGWVAASIVSPAAVRRAGPGRAAAIALGAQSVLLTAGAVGVSGSLIGVLGLALGVGLAGGVVNNSAVTLASLSLPRGDAGRGLAGFQFLRSVGSGVGSSAAGLSLGALGPVSGLRVAQLAAALVSAAAILALRPGRRPVTAVVPVAVSGAAPAAPDRQEGSP